MTFFKALGPERIAYVERSYRQARRADEFFERDGWRIERWCPHRQADLTRFGEISDGVLTCSLHHWQFELETGRCLTSDDRHLRCERVRRLIRRRLTARATVREAAAVSRVAFNHVGQCVADLERSKRFYGELLGFTLDREIQPTDDLSAQLLGLTPPLGMTAAYLVRDGLVLELLHYAAAGQTQPFRPRALNEPGLTHLSVSVEDVDGDPRPGARARRRGARRHEHRVRRSSCATPTASCSSSCRSPTETAWTPGSPRSVVAGGLERARASSGLRAASMRSRPIGGRSICEWKCVSAVTRTGSGSSRFRLGFRFRLEHRLPARLGCRRGNGDRCGAGLESAPRRSSRRQPCGGVNVRACRSQSSPAARVAVAWRVEPYRLHAGIEREGRGRHRTAAGTRTLSSHGDEGTACMCAHRANLARSPRDGPAMQRDWIVRVPASSANFGPAFDAVAIALDRHLEVTDRGAPAPETHPAVRAFRQSGGEGPLSVRASFPGGRGLGYSGAARVAGLLAAVAQRGNDRASRRDEVLRDASELEGHADNAAASVYGGIVAVAAGHVVRIPLARVPAVVVWIPDRETPTVSARRLLPEQVPFDDAVFNVGAHRAAGRRARGR